MNRIPRRTMLQAMTWAGLSLPAMLNALPHRLPPQIPELPLHWQGQPLGRVTGLYQNARSQPSTSAEILIQHQKDDIVRVRRAVPAEAVWFYNALWLETDNGYMYSSYVQPMWYHLPNTPVAEPGEGRWAEVTVPYTDGYWDPDDRIGDRFVSRAYYGCVFRVVGLVTGADGRSWYKVEELNQSYFMRATHLRLIPDEDLLPLSPEVAPQDKWIEVDLAQQILIAWEEDIPVFAHRVSTGLPGYGTPEGTYYIFDKRISERMVGGLASSEEFGDYYNLPGVPFVCYFTAEWVATHGTYWHNDFGQPHSHGCVNVPSYAAKWLWRWTTPYVTGPDLNQFYVRPEYRIQGTRVEVHS